MANVRLLIFRGLVAALAAQVTLLATAGCGIATGSQVQSDSEFEPLNVGSLREAQRLSNDLFELTPGEVIQQAPVSATSAFPAGERWDVKLRVRNLHETLSLHHPFWAVSAIGFDADGREVPAFAYLPSWGGFGRAGALGPSKELTGTMVVIGDKLAGWVVYWRYEEPGRTGVEASFVYPYGRR